MSIHSQVVNDVDNHQPNSKKIIEAKVKMDHLSYQKQLPVKKNLSSYTSAYRNDGKDVAEQNSLEEFRRKIAPPTLDAHLLKRSLHQSTLHYSPTKVSPLPNIVAQSSYKRSFYQKSNQKSPKAKQQAGFFLKMSWHDSPSSNYRKSYQKSGRQPLELQKGKAVQGHLVVLKKKFTGHTNYEDCYSPLLRTKKIDSKDCIKNKDHLSGLNCTLMGESQYHTKFDSMIKSNLPKKSIQKQAAQTNKENSNFLPKIRRNKSQIQLDKTILAENKTIISKNIRNSLGHTQQIIQCRNKQSVSTLVKNQQPKPKRQSKQHNKSKTNIYHHLEKSQQSVQKQKVKKHQTYHIKKGQKQNLHKQELNISRKLYQKGMNHTTQIAGTLPKKSTKLRSTKKNSLNQDMNSSTTHSRIFGVIKQQN